MNREKWLLLGLVIPVAIIMALMFAHPVDAGKLEDAIAKTDRKSVV